jgi:hypothetical protein
VSHVVQIRTEIRDPAAIREACRRLHLDQPEQGTFKLFSAEATGLGVKLPDWRYPVVCVVATGQVQFDNFEGRWGEQKELDRLMQAYAVEKATLEARRRGHSTTEQTLSDGSIKLTVQVAGGVA